MKLIIQALLLLCLTLIVVSPSHACNSGWSTKLIAEQISALNKADAIDRLNQTLLQTNNSNASEDIDSSTNLSRIDCYLKNQTVEGMLHAKLLADIQPSLAKISNQFHQANSAELKQALISHINRNIVRDAGTGFVLFPGANNNRVEINLFYKLIDRHCQQVATIRCSQSTELAQNLWFIAGEFRALADQLNQPNKKASLAFNNNLTSQWQSYKDDTIKLWPQEVLLNSMIYRPSNKGLSAPPNYKLLTLRPALGLSYLSDQSHRFQPTVNLDLLGLYWWHYEANGKASMGRGISATAIWDGDDTALGLSYHHSPKWSLTLAQGDENDVVVSLSFQLAHWLVNR